MKILKLLTTVFAIVLMFSSCKATSLSASDETPPQHIYPLEYDSYDELISSVKNDFQSDFYSDYIGNENSDICDTFARFISTLRQNGIPVPCGADGRLPLRDQDGYSNISLFITELYSLPWIWYHPAVPTDENVFVQVTPIPDSISNDLSNGSASELIRMIAPGAANIDNYEHMETYSRIYESELSLKDRTVSALKYEYKNDARDATIFLYDGLIVIVRATPSVWDAQWFSQLSFEYAPSMSED